MNHMFKEKFTSYLTKGLPVKIEKDEITIFYEELNKFINDSSADFNSSYIQNMNKVAIYDKQIDYLTVSYEDNKIIFRTTDQTSDIALIDPVTKRKLGEAFIGVVLFVESLAPSEDSVLISRSYSDKWFS